MNRPGYSLSRECGEVNILGFSPTLRWIITLAYTKPVSQWSTKITIFVFLYHILKSVNKPRSWQLFHVSVTISASLVKFTRRIMFKSKILHWKTLKPNLVASFLLIGMAFSFISEIKLCLNFPETGTPFCYFHVHVMWARNILGYSKIGNQSERAKNTMHWFGIC